MRLFIRFSYHFFKIIGRFHAVFLSLFAMIVGIAAILVENCSNKFLGIMIDSQSTPKGQEQT